MLLLISTMARRPPETLAIKTTRTVFKTGREVSICRHTWVDMRVTPHCYVEGCSAHKQRSGIRSRYKYLDEK
jgi:hypothetical protein